MIQNHSFHYLLLSVDFGKETALKKTIIAQRLLSIFFIHAHIMDIETATQFAGKQRHDFSLKMFSSLGSDQFKLRESEFQ